MWMVKHSAIAFRCRVWILKHTIVVGVAVVMGLETTIRQEVCNSLSSANLESYAVVVSELTTKNHSWFGRSIV